MNQYLDSTKTALDDLGDLQGKDVLVAFSDEEGADIAKQATKKGAIVLVVSAEDFLIAAAEKLGSFDLVVLNAVASEDEQAARLSHAVSFLKPDGQISAVVHESFREGATQSAKQIRSLLHLALASVDPIGVSQAKEGAGCARVLIAMKSLLERIRKFDVVPASRGLVLGAKAQQVLASPAA